MRHYLLAATLGLATVVLPASPATAMSKECDRACLRATMDEYLTALVARDPKKVRLAPNVRFTENGMELKVGDGLWGTANGFGNYRHYFEDAREGQAGFVGTLRENDRLIVLVARLKVSSSRVSEIETVVVRFDNSDVPNGPEILDAVKGPDPMYEEVLAPSARRSREELRRITNSYFEGFHRGSKAGVPIDPKCNRYNTGKLATNVPNPVKPVNGLSCADAIDFAPFTTSVTDRRFPIIDQERGVVFAIAFFNHNGSVRSMKNPDGSIRMAPPVFQKPSSTMVAELFKIVDGKILRLDAFDAYVTYGADSGWP